MTIAAFGQIEDGRQVDSITIASDQLTVKILTLGAILNDVRLDGVDYPLTLGSTTVDGYRGPLSSFGSLMGPVINRIKGCSATIDGQKFTFEKHRSGNHTQHSGSTGMQKQIWDVADRGTDFVTLCLDLADGLGGFPGNRTVKAHYAIEGAALRLTVSATTDAPTWMNPANHSYWSLDDGIGFAGHTLTVDADEYTETDDNIIPTGNLIPVNGTDRDLRNGVVLAGDNSQFFDWNLCTAASRVPFRPVATLTGASGVKMIMSTTECGLQIYDCGTINAPGYPTHHGDDYGPYSGIALEAQSWPGAEHHSSFPSIALRPGEDYTQITEWAFSKP